MSEFYITTRNFRVDTDWFRINKDRKGKHDLSHYLSQINLDRYIIYKATRSFREVDIYNIHKLEYAVYILFNKEIYEREDINRWIEFLNDINVRFMDKPPPSIKYIDKIKIIQ